MQLQKPFGTKWGPAATAQDVSDETNLTGRTIVVTGGASGLGLETTRVLSMRGAHVIAAVRDIESAKVALAGMSRVEISQLDLTNIESVDRFANERVTSGRPIDQLICNAGVMACPLFRDAAGNEGQFATNHLGHFRLTTRLWPLLISDHVSRVIVVSSRAHHFGSLALDDLKFERRPYDKWLAYGQSKQANALFAVALDVRGREFGVRAYSLHPGSILGPLARHLTREEIEPFGAVDEAGNPIIDPAHDLKSFEQGAATTVWCATSELLENVGGVYCENSDVASLEAKSPFGVRPFAVDPNLAEELWLASAQITGTDIS